METILVTGSAGLIGSEAVRFFAEKDFKVIGVDNNAREYFFGSNASTDWNRQRLEKKYKNYEHLSLDIRDIEAIEKIFKKNACEKFHDAAAFPTF